jgi:hypothetical protein
VVTVDIRGARFVETVLTAQALERVGVKTVLMTLEETSENGLAPRSCCPCPSWCPW